MPVSFTAVMSTIGTLLLIVAIFVGAYYFSRLVGANYGGSSFANTPSNIEIIERRVVSKDQSFMIIKVAGETILVGATNQSIQKIQSLNEDLIVEPKGKSDVNFKAVFKDVLRKSKESND